MIRVDFDQPAYLRASSGLAILSFRLQHLLPRADQKAQDVLATEPVVINRLFGGRLESLDTDSKDVADETIKGEYLPLNVESDQAQHHNGDVELNFDGVKGKAFTGVYGGSGHAHYRFNKKKGKSFFVRIGKHIIWGIELSPEIRRSGAARGEVIKITFMGKEPVTVLKSVSKGDQADSEWVNTHKNLWKVEVVR